MGKQGAGMGAAMGTEEMQGVKPIVSEWQGGRAA